MAEEQDKKEEGAQAEACATEPPAQEPAQAGAGMATNEAAAAAVTAADDAGKLPLSSWFKLSHRLALTGQGQIAPVALELKLDMMTPEPGTGKPIHVSDAKLAAPNWQVMLAMGMAIQEYAEGQLKAAATRSHAIEKVAANPDLLRAIKNGTIRRVH